MHAFCREVKLTHGAWLAACEFLRRAGDISDDKRNEFILIADILGVEVLVDMLDRRPCLWRYQVIRPSCERQAMRADRPGRAPDRAARQAATGAGRTVGAVLRSRAVAPWRSGAPPGESSRMLP